MDISQLKAFISVARAGTITRASELLHLSQPAVSAQIKALEESLGIVLFERTARGMLLSTEGARMLVKAEKALAMHQEVLDEATRIKGHLTGKVTLGVGNNSSHEAIGRLVATFALRLPEVRVVLKHGTSADILAGIREGSLDAGFYNEAAEPPPDLATVGVAEFKVYLAAAPGLIVVTEPLDWATVAELPWVYPTASACCGRAAEDLFRLHRVRPARVLSVDREDVTRSLVAGGIGVGLLHAPTAHKAQQRGEVELLAESPGLVRTLFAHGASRSDDPLLRAAASILSDKDA